MIRIKSVMRWGINALGRSIGVWERREWGLVGYVWR